ncbi:translation factor GTPase family protein [Velocimicrobium porci]|uniref:GTP-binding protein n=1 Tax=Velocimicrobium porci TaxID=2606634 RepID=A0A6L5Y1S4_9FIRM|nr:TetM/TetW/TetO/TetS family tetracycline resistance ribosomal protection protein [Velocimicrobium porci]MSS64869.1 GTP-binding protein [Velocimicrobium porci]
MKKLVVGVLAHVDAGKTTLSEAMLYLGGSIRKLGRVDNKDAFLDNYELERARGITIFSKQAVFSWNNTQITLLDTPGHMDFSAEMERTLQVLDYAILIVSGADGVQGHTETLWHLLKKYKIPVFIFINKMDQNGTEKEMLLQELKSRLSENCINFNEKEKESFYETVAMCDEELLEAYLEQGSIEKEKVRQFIAERKIFPCFFGSALKMQGVEEFLNDFGQYTKVPCYPDAFGAKIYKIARDVQGTRLTYMKITGGSLKVKTEIEGYREKVNQIRVYSGEKYEVENEVSAGSICAVTGLSKTKPGEVLGSAKQSFAPILEPVLTYQVLLPLGCDAATMLPNLRILEEEEPALHVVWDETLKEIQVQIMGEVQLEILKSLIKDRFHINVEFGTGNIVYKETIKGKVEGVGHFEPLRHYAEVHLILEEAEPGSGIAISSNCSEDMLEKNWQRLILTHLAEKEHKGVLTGSAITDVKITLVAGRAHQKHTEGGDFREATYRAVRQGLKQAESVLLEPYYEYRLEVPEKLIGRAMTDIERMYGTFEIQESKSDVAVLTGIAPVVTMQDYQKEVIAYTKGMGKLFCSLKGYEPCHNTEEVVNRIHYDSEKDIENPAGSVFCSHGSGFFVGWDEVKNYMHVESQLVEETELIDENKVAGRKNDIEEEWIDVEEIDSILARTFYANQKDKSLQKKSVARKKEFAATPTVRKWNQPEKLEEYLLVDGYNIIFAWEDLKELSKVNIDSARDKLMDILCNYQGIKGSNLIVVFDAYRVQGHQEEIFDYHNIHVVYTKEAETADQFIEKFAHQNKNKYRVTVATSDCLEQIITRGQGSLLLSARELREEIEKASKELQTEYLDKQIKGRNFLFDSLSADEKQKLEEQTGKTRIR